MRIAKRFNSSRAGPTQNMTVVAATCSAFAVPPPPGGGGTRRRRSFAIVNCTNEDKIQPEEDLGVKAALSMLKFYKREISPLMPNSCRYVPTCSEYSMEAYKRYGVAKGTILTAWRLCRCNPLGGSGFDPPRWFGEENSPE